MTEQGLEKLTEVKQEKKVCCHDSNSRHLDSVYKHIHVSFVYSTWTVIG